MENARTDQIPICDRRYYGVFAVNKDNPNDMYGHVENSFSMGWSRYFVSLNEGFREWQVKKATELWLRDSTSYQSDDKKFSEWFKSFEKDLYHKGMSVEEMRRTYYDVIFDMKAESLMAQNIWNGCFNKCHVPAGYDVKVFRLNSKNCPVEVDLRYRIACNRGKTKTWDKWLYRNALFCVKAWNKNVSVVDLNPTFADFFKTCGKIARVQLGDGVKYETVVRKSMPYKDRLISSEHSCGIIKKRDDSMMSRSERQTLRKQRRNSFSAKKGSPESVSIARKGQG